MIICSVELLLPGPSALGPLSAPAGGQSHGEHPSLGGAAAAGGSGSSSTTSVLNSDDDSSIQSELDAPTASNAASVATFEELAELVSGSAPPKTAAQQTQSSMSEMPTRPSSPAIAIGEAQDADVGGVPPQGGDSPPLASFSAAVHAPVTRRTSALHDQRDERSVKPPAPSRVSRHGRAMQARVHSMRQALRQGVGEFLPARAVAAGHLARAAVQAAPATAVMDAARRRRAAIIGLEQHMDLLQSAADLPAPSRVAAALAEAQRFAPGTQQVAPIRSAVLHEVLLPLLQDVVHAAIASSAGGQGGSGEGSQLQQSMQAALKYAEGVVISAYVNPLVGRINSKHDVAVLDADAVRTVLAGMLASYACRHMLHSAQARTQQKIATAYSTSLFVHRCILLGVLQVAGLPAARLAALGIAAVAEGTFGEALPAILNATHPSTSRANDTTPTQVLLALGGMRGGDRAQQARFVVRAVAEAAELQDALQGTHDKEEAGTLTRTMAAEGNSAAALPSMQQSAHERTALRLALLLSLLPEAAPVEADAGDTKLLRGVESETPQAAV